LGDALERRSSSDVNSAEGPQHRAPHRMAFSIRECYAAGATGLGYKEEGIGERSYSEICAALAG